MSCARLFRSLFSKNPLLGRRRRSHQSFGRDTESLEWRMLLTTYTVTSSTDTQAELGSLRAMINNANLNSNPGNVIAFASNVTSIVVNPALGPLPTVLVPVTMDGGVNGVSIVGTSLTGTPTGLYFNASGNHVSNMAVYGFGGTQMIFASDSNVVQKNFIGTNLAQSFKGGQIGLAINGASNDVSNNVISGLTGGYSAMYVTGAGANHNQVHENFIGTRKDGSSPLPNIGTGLSILFGASSNEIWGNVISANSVDGIDIGGVGTSLNLIEGNYVGTDKTGTTGGTALANQRDGVEIFGGASSNMIGGTITSVGQKGGGNVISNNAQEGVDIYDTDSNITRMNTVVGNFIGTDKPGMKALPNLRDGVLICLSATMNTIGGTDAAHANVISGNTKAGVRIGNEEGGTGESPATQNIVQDNFIGTNSTKTTNLGNGTYGVYINGNKNIVGAPYGSTNQALGNWIEFNGQKDPMKGDGVTVDVDPQAAGGASTTGQQNTIRLNHIDHNKRLGIDLNDNYFDVYDGQTNTSATPRANNGAWHPTIIGVSGSLVNWMLNAPASGTYVVDIYSDTQNQYTDYAEGQTFLMSVVPTFIDGHFEFSTNTGTDKITAIATDSKGNSSEFSLADKDADGLADPWEANGFISLHGKPGESDVKLPGASVDHKNLYVEYDSMTGWGPVAGVTAADIGVFANAPAASVNNPDGKMGITLYLKVGNQSITPQIFGPNPKLDTTWKDFQTVKSHNFANGDPTSDAYKASLLAYRYCVFGVSYGGTGSSGLAEVHGNDFMVTLADIWGGGKTAAQQSLVANNHVMADQSGTFLHEFGHTLGLSHQGPTNWNGTFVDTIPEYDASYKSVMNYRYQAPDVGFRDASGHFISDPSILNYSTTNPDEWHMLWFSFQENPQSLRGSDTSTLPIDEPPDLPQFIVNHAPIGTAKSVAALEDTPYVFKATDFGFTDPNNTPANTLLAVKFATLPLVGLLTDNGVAVAAGVHVPVADITAGKLKFLAAANKSGTAYASFTFQVQDSGGTANSGVDTDPIARKLTINVTSVNDAPLGSPKTVATLEDTAYVFKTTDFAFTDPNDVPPNMLLGVKVTSLPLVGSLTDNGVAVVAGTHVAAADIIAGKFKFTPATNKNGTAYASFTFQVQDNGGTTNGGLDTDLTPRKMTISVS